MNKSNLVILGLNSVLLIFMGVFSVSLKNQVEEVKNYKESLNQQVNFMEQEFKDLNESVKFLSASIPDNTKRNAHAQVVKNIIKQNQKNTKTNYFASDGELNFFAFSVVDFSEKYGVPASLILAVARAESNFDPKGKSSTGAKGITQIMDATFQGCASSLGKAHYDVYNVHDAVECTTLYLSRLRHQFTSYEEVVKSYNVGEAYIQKYGTENVPEETKNYHANVVAFLDEYKNKIFWEKL